MKPKSQPAIEFQRPDRLLSSSYEEILLADLGTKPRLSKPGRFGTFLSSHFMFSGLDAKPFIATVDFLGGKFPRKVNDKTLEVRSKAVGVSFKLETGSKMKNYMIKEILNRSYFDTGGCWKEVKVDKGPNDTDREWVFCKSNETTILGYYDAATRVLTVWDSSQCIAILEGDHITPSAIGSRCVGPASVPAPLAMESAAETGEGPDPPPAPMPQMEVEEEIDLENLDIPFLGAKWID